jgi:hypothetical protein
MCKRLRIQIILAQSSPPLSQLSKWNALEIMLGSPRPLLHTWGYRGMCAPPSKERNATRPAPRSGVVGTEMGGSWQRDLFLWEAWGKRVCVCNCSKWLNRTTKHLCTFFLFCIRCTGFSTTLIPPPVYEYYIDSIDTLARLSHLSHQHTFVLLAQTCCAALTSSSSTNTDTDRNKTWQRTQRISREW